MGENIEKAIEILQKTNDGNGLAPEHLKLVELAVNNFLSVNGQIAFDELFTQVESGDYKQPWFHGIENLLIDHEGYIYWKGREVEHYEQPFAYSERGKESALEVAERCKLLESIGVDVNTTNVIWKWETIIGKEG